MKTTTREFEHLPFNAFWEKGYKDGNVSTMGGPNHDIVELAAALPPGTRVLDLGCGEGRNAFFLAGRGCQVTAVDRSAAGIEKLSALAKRTGVPLRAVVADIAELELRDTWDVIMAHGVIDYLDNRTWRSLLARLKAHTAPGGYNAYTCMLFTDEYPAGPEFLAAGFKHSLAQGELAAFYGDWEQVRHDRYVKWDQHPGIPLHCHPVDKLVARKPGGGGPAPRREPVPVGEVDLPRALFDSVAMGTPAEEVLARCGEPAVVDTFTMEGVQLGVGPTDSLTVDGYRLSLWYYGRAVLYVINGRVWGRALHDSLPVRMTFG
ncbi:methyltransferase domain-containing protein [Myxococcus sp. RHSTA-1-4]|uniref:methyltransferase domain-containing protein n=1 Tax=Myxococcus sp. RHSTA-1-4 TaxID=2874601 RepID=UPI001CBBC276|nr:methyltransferase domain-containing protein [Myxococcus sp. RHSTA-1-4]MBZ4422781.1 methyltransferase domain-containing protein [Myxococcus sp. RHSTA-1-4]